LDSPASALYALTGAPVSTYSLILDPITEFIPGTITGVNSSTTPFNYILDKDGAYITVNCSNTANTKS
jgi:hypothetical protein